MSTRPKRQHYVPRFYLGRFAEDGQISVLDKKTGRTFATNILNVGCESYFYDVRPELLHNPADAQLVERQLALLDEHAAAMIAQVVDRAGRSSNRKIRARTRILDDELRGRLAEVTAVQLMRTREFRELILQGVQLWGAAASEDLTASGELDRPFRLNVSPDDAGLIHAQVAFGNDSDRVFRIAEILYNHIWVVGFAGRAQVSLLTSDNPVVRWNRLNGSSGLSVWGVEIAFPLSPTVVLLIAERRAYEAYSTRDGCLVALSNREVRFYNSLQIACSTAQIYGSAAAIELARKYLEIRPSLCNADRARVILSRGDRQIHPAQAPEADDFFLGGFRPEEPDQS